MPEYQVKIEGNEIVVADNGIDAKSIIQDIIDSEIDLDLIITEVTEIV